MGWRAYLAESDDESPNEILFCSRCAEREFGPFGLERIEELPAEA
jgi:hypothetical protein